MLHFLRPEWFLALLPLVLIMWLLWRTEQSSSTWNRYISPHLAALLITKTTEIKRPSLWYLAVSWLIAVVALSGPAVTQRSLPVFESAQGRVIIMDMSLSMYATDQAPNRLSQAKFKATDLIGELTEGETGLVAYAGDAYTISPLTRDRSTLLNLLPTLSPDIMPVRGSNLVSALEQSKTLLAQGGHISGDILLLSDGVSPKQLNEAKKTLNGTQYRLGILALGSEQGAPIRLPDGQLLRDNANQVVVAKTNYAQLNELAQDSGGILIPYRTDGQDLQRLFSWLSTTAEAKATQLDGEIWQDAGPFIALLLLIPVLLSFRHGLVCAALVCIIYQPTPAMASGWDDVWQTKNQQGMAAYQAQEYQGASEKFSDPQWQASARYKAGDYDAALDLFEQDNSAAGLYNQGNTLMQQGKYNEAIKRYERAVKNNPEFKDAQENLDLAKKLEQQKKDSSEQDDNSDQGDPSDKDENSDKSKESKQEKGDGSEQENGSEQDENSEQADDAQPDKNSDPKQKHDQQASDDSSQENSNESEMQAEPDNNKPENPQDEAAQQSSGSVDENGDNTEEQKTKSSPAEMDEESQEPSVDSAKAAQQAQTQDELPPEMERALRALADDPQVLLRNKMQLEYQKRRRQGIAAQEQEQW